MDGIYRICDRGHVDCGVAGSSQDIDDLPIAGKHGVPLSHWPRGRWSRRGTARHLCSPRRMSRAARKGLNCGRLGFEWQGLVCLVMEVAVLLWEIVFVIFRQAPRVCHRRRSKQQPTSCVSPTVQCCPGHLPCSSSAMSARHGAPSQEGYPSSSPSMDHSNDPFTTAQRRYYDNESDQVEFGRRERRETYASDTSNPPVADYDANGNYEYRELPCSPVSISVS